jgi:hypothetical protein
MDGVAQLVGKTRRSLHPEVLDDMTKPYATEGEQDRSIRRPCPPTSRHACQATAGDAGSSGRECEAVTVIRAFFSMLRVVGLGVVVLGAAALVAAGCSHAGPDTDEAAVCRAVQDLVDALHRADPPAAVAAFDRVGATGRRTNNHTLSSRAVALARASVSAGGQPEKDVNAELVSVAAACGDAGRPIRGLR